MKKLTLLLMLLLVSSLVTGLGLAPAKTKFDFSANTTSEGVFRIIVDNIPSKIMITTQGELGKYISLEKEVLTVEEHETWVKFNINQPKELPAGDRVGDIIVMEVPASNLNENVVLAAPAIIHKVWVSVPYPGKYLSSKLYITNQDLKQPVLFTIGIGNFGQEDVKKVSANIVIKGPTNEEIAVLNTDETPLGSGKEGKLTTYWQAENPGSYVAEVNLNYDGKSQQITQRFDVGNMELEIETIQVNNFRIGQIAKMDIYLRNIWNKPLSVNGKVEVFKDDRLVSSFNTVSVDIPERSSAIMEGYWNTQDLEVGEYDISVKASYGDKTKEKSFSSVISIDEMQIKDYVSGRVVDTRENKRTTLLVVLVLIVIISNISLFIYINKKLQRTQ